MTPSLPPLRSWRSTIYAPSRDSANVVNRAVESQASIDHHLPQQQQQQHYESSVTELRRRLARKASTFSLRGKNRRSQRYLRDLVKAEESKKKKEQESETTSVKTVTQEGEQGNNEQGDKEVTNLDQDPTPGLPACGILPSFAAATTRFRQDVPHPQKRQHTSASSMASDSSASPVPFARLQKIATEACDSTLESATSYVHANTADWNTTIINTILQKLVKETTTEQAQPQYKYIVNSTIIQHAVGGDGGRRGMHAASGAYWNNEKDGMWSFKYEAAEEKGLDVVVGIIWVWIG